MLGLKLAIWDCRASYPRLIVMAAVIAAALSTYTVIGGALREMSGLPALTHRLQWPWDVVVTGPAAHEIAPRVREVTGVVSVTKAYLPRAILGSGIVQVLTFAGEPSGRTFDFEQGGPPEGPDQVSLPRDLADSIGASVGSEVLLIPVQSVEPGRYTVSGILAPKAGNLPFPLVTLEGGARLQEDLSAVATLLVVLDGRASIGAVESQIRNMAPGLNIQSNREQYSRVNEAVGLADTLADSLRFLILVISASSVAALYHLFQRERAHQIGVLRAVGATRFALMVSAILQTVLVVSAGSAAGLAVVKALQSPMRLHFASFAALMSDAGTLSLAALLVVLVSQRLLLGKSVCSLLTDPWGRS